MIRIKNRETARMPGTGRKRSGFQNGVLFSVLAAGAAVMAGITGTGCYVTVLAADNVEQSQVMTGDDSLRLTGGGTSGDADDSVITPRLFRSRYQIKNELTFTFTSLGRAKQT